MLLDYATSMYGQPLGALQSMQSVCAHTDLSPKEVNILSLSLDAALCSYILACTQKVTRVCTNIYTGILFPFARTFNWDLFCC